MHYCFLELRYNPTALAKRGVGVVTYLTGRADAQEVVAEIQAQGAKAVATDFGGAVRDDEELNAYLASETALGRVGVPDDIGGAVAAFLSEDNRWVNAQRIEISGGMFL